MDENTKEDVQPIVAELDYDKLAEAIVKAQKIAKEQEIVALQEQKKKKKWWARIKDSIIGTMEPVSVTMRIFSIILFLTFLALGFIGVSLSIPFIQIFREEIIAAQVSVAFGKVAYYALMIFAEIFSIALIVASIEILISKDKNFVVSVFSAMTSLVALIVAFVALS